MRQLTQAILLVIFFTADFDNKRAGLWMITLRDWSVQLWSDAGP